MATQYVAPVNGTWAAKTSSPFGAARDGGHRLHAGSDLQAANGAPAVAAIGGQVIYAGHNSGYQWNAVVVGDDGNAFRYATHGPLSVKVGDRVEQGQQIGTIARGHLHLEVIPGGSPVFNDMVAHPGTFVGTQFYPGGKPVTVDPTAFFGVERGARIAAGKAVGSGAGTLVPEVVDDPFGVAKFQREQAASARDEQGALASLEAPGGGPSVPDMPTAAMGYAPDLPGGMPPAPPMPQIMASAKVPLPTPPPQWTQNAGFPIDEALSGRSAQDVLMGGPRTDPRRAAPGTGPIQSNMGAMLSAEDVLSAGPRMRPGGAPDASAVPMPQISPFRPAMGGPADRRPTPPTPPMRPGGAPDAASVPTPPPRAQGIPNPRPRGTPYAPAFPSLYGEQPSPLAGGMSAGMGNAPPSAPPTPPRATREFWNSIGLGSRGTPETQLSIDGPPVPPPEQPPPSLDGVDSRSLMAAMEVGQNRRLFEGPFGAGDLRPQSSPPPGATPPIGNVNYSDMPIQRLPQTQAAVNVPGMGLGPYGMTPPPAELNFANADPGPTFVPPGGPKDIAIPRSPFEGSSGTGFTYAPPMPSPPPAMSQMSRDQFNISFSPGGPGMIADLSGPRPTPPQPAPDPFAALFGPGGAMGAMPFTQEEGMAGRSYPPATPMPSYPLKPGDQIKTSGGGPVWDVGSVSGNGRSMLVAQKQGDPGNMMPIQDKWLSSVIANGGEIDRAAPLPRGGGGDPFASAYGPRGVGPAPPRIVGSPEDAYFYSPQPLSEVPAPLTTTPPAPAAPFRPSGLGPSIAAMPWEGYGALETSVVKPAPGQDVTASAPGRTFVKAEDYFKPPAVPGTIAQAATMGLTEPKPQRQRNSLGRFIGGGLLSGVGSVFGGLLNSFGQSSAFTPFAGMGGIAPSTGFNGQSFNTAYRQGSVTGNPNMQGTMWNRSNGGSVGYVTDPVTGFGHPIYSSSPSTF